MNKEHLEGIRTRWLAASSGPWSLIDYRDDDVRRGGLSPEAAEAFEKFGWQWAGIVCMPPHRLKQLQGDTDRAVSRAFQKHGLQEPTDDEIESKPETKVNNAIHEGPRFLIMPTLDGWEGAKQADITFVLYAAQDMSDLLDGVDALTTERERLEAQLETERQRNKELSHKLAAVDDRLRGFARAAKAVLEVADGAT